MFRTAAFAFLLAAAHAAAPGYPRWEEVVRAPQDFDLLYSTRSGTLNETWYFGGTYSLKSIIIPTQINICSSGPLTGSTYEEEIEINLYQTKLSTAIKPTDTILAATGFFNGTIKYGQELEIALRVPQTDEWPPVYLYTNGNTGYRYIVSIVFKTTGVYPWYTTRTLSSCSVVSSYTNVPGIAIGLTYTRR